ncbi:glycine-rich domain-containing protein [Deinococcus enclensis]|uniref:TIGR04222 domain-containing membrane protein n=1 Tax=Deinococcus enclensis TaxID=1049582 RepID=A0ABT9M9C7_9DEIO|nr:hypothetical protein [Deinococcus enclensis]MDP9763187.1 hypothetical protein [Deinococcus enclensis]
MTVPTPTKRHADVSPGLDPHTREVILAWPFPPAMLDRLAQEHRWTPDFTGRALTEYRRFLVLALTSPTPVTPSRTVDEVWHTHLTFTRDYWEALRPRLPRPLHHDPGSGDSGDPQRYAAQYTATLALYEETFGAPPPADLWPTASPAPASPPSPPPVRPGRRPLAPPLRAGLAASTALIALLLFGLPLAASAVLGGVVFAVSGLLAASGGVARGRQDPALAGAGSSSGTFWGSDPDSCDPSGSDGGCGDGGGSCGSSCGGGGCSS